MGPGTHPTKKSCGPRVLIKARVISQRQLWNTGTLQEQNSGEERGATATEKKKVPHGDMATYTGFLLTRR